VYRKPYPVYRNRPKLGGMIGLFCFRSGRAGPRRFRSKLRLEAEERGGYLFFRHQLNVFEAQAPWSRSGLRNMIAGSLSSCTAGVPSILQVPHDHPAPRPLVAVGTVTGVGNRVRRGGRPQNRGGAARAADPANEHGEPGFGGERGRIHGELLKARVLRVRASRVSPKYMVKPTGGPPSRGMAHLSAVNHAQDVAAMEPVSLFRPFASTCSTPTSLCGWIAERAGLDQRHNTSDPRNGVLRARSPKAFPVERSSALLDPPDRDRIYGAVVTRRLPAPWASGTSLTAQPRLGKNGFGRTADRIDPARVRRSYDCPGRGAICRRIFEILRPLPTTPSEHIDLCNKDAPISRPTHQARNDSFTFGPSAGPSPSLRPGLSFPVHTT